MDSEMSTAVTLNERAEAPDPGLAAFTQQLFAGAAEDDLAAHSPEALQEIAQHAFDFFSARVPGRTQIRLSAATGNGNQDAATAIEIANDDMPFLVDSTLNVLNELGYPILFVLHPIIAVRRDARGKLIEVLAPGSTAEGGVRESFMYIEVSGVVSEAQRERLKHELEETLADVRTAVLDWRPMQRRVMDAIEAYHRNPPPIPVEELTEGMAFLQWLVDNHFTFLGARDYKFAGSAESGELEPVPGSGLGILRKPEMQVLKRGGTMVTITPEIRAFLMQPAPLIITKSDVMATVHRRAPMEYIGIKQFDTQGELTGELRIVGLFTSTAYTRSPRDIPLIRRKIERVIAASGLNPQSHSGKGLINVLETFPRDELFQIDVPTLSDMAHGIMRLAERPRARLFVRRDKFDRFISAFVFLPRDRFNTDNRIKVGDLIAQAYGGRVTSFEPAFGEGTLVRVHFMIARDPDTTPSPDTDKLEDAIRDVIRTWDDTLATAAAAKSGTLKAQEMEEHFRGAFPAGYTELYSPEESLEDVAEIEKLGEGDIAIAVWRSPEDGPATCRVKLYRFGQPIPLSARLPVLEAMGLKAIEEHSFTLSPVIGGERRQVFVHDVAMQVAAPELLADPTVPTRLENAFLAVWRGIAENDAYNGLILSAGLDWRQVVVLRACGKYLRQAGIQFSNAYIMQTILKHSAVARDLVALFEIRFDPKNGLALEQRQARSVQKAAEIEEQLEAVPSLDEDRILRRFLNLIRALLRTTYYQPAPGDERYPTVSFKIDSRSLDELPEPRPFAEIFVYSPRVEGVHLRAGPIARGGLRWSDRPEDFRTEVLGLEKAQNVKNAVIVPVGAKGGFVPKRLPVGGSRDEVMAEGTSAYKLFVSSMLDLTDNIVDGKTEAPPDVVRFDNDDPYLVVAADKGTATFSDIANAIAAEHHFWLDDAFASGGSAGYDHKGMGITARGAWEAVKRHFREMDVDIETTPFTVAGVGDMSGDVFGNGMLLSRQIRLVAAFDHRDIFIDPDPDPETSFAERQRLFNLPRSSWRDYDASKISRGGGVFSRSLKAVALTPEIRALTGLAQDSVTPNELISAVLKLKVDLMWFGGIGTYVRGTHEINADVGDRANDAVRIAADQLAAKVVGEGANLALTQRGRIDFALRGGRINTDAVDNSAGVNSSDVEVNIKIATGAAEAAGKLARPERNKLLVDMTDEVARAVLRNNYLQTLCLSMAELRGVEEFATNARLIRTLEQAQRLVRHLEQLPDETELTEREAAKRPLTRPELAVLMAHAKLALFDELNGSPVPDDPYLGRELIRYFPRKLSEAFPEEVRTHRLRREIISTQLANSMINRGGPNFVWRLKEETRFGVTEIAPAYALARDSFDFVGLNGLVDALDGKIGGRCQLDLYVELQNLLRRATIWFLRNVTVGAGLAELVAQYSAGISELSQILGAVLPPSALQRMADRRQVLVDQGVPADVAERFAGLRYMQRGPDIVQVAAREKQSIETVARLFFEVGSALAIDRLVGQAMQIPPSRFHERMAINRTVDGILQTHRAIVARALRGDGGKPQGWSAWSAERSELLQRTRREIDELLRKRPFDLSRLTLCANQLGELAKE
jgi:glutamate dehydrogenase